MILDEIDEFSEDITVIVTRIINRRCRADDPPCPESDLTTDFNSAIIDIARKRSDPGYSPGDIRGGCTGKKTKSSLSITKTAPHRVIHLRLQIILVVRNMWDNLHPFETGYEKMAAIWYDALDDFLPVCTTPEIVITSSPVTEAYLGHPYRYDVDATGRPAPTYSLTSGPAGMVIDGTTGNITWTPSAGQVGSHPVTVMASNGILPDTTQDFTVQVLEVRKLPG